ncbi:hypothetical protein GCM10027285_27330 [Oleiagrimonas citrea]
MQHLGDFGFELAGLGGVRVHAYQAPVKRGKWAPGTPSPADMNAAIGAATRTFKSRTGIIGA